MSFYVMGLDLGQSKDYTALAIVEATPTKYTQTVVGRERETGLPIDRDIQVEGPPVSLALRHLERPELGTPYTEIVRQVSERLRAIPGALVAVDKTGVGAAVVDMFADQHLLTVAITITSGDTVHGEGREWRVPKRDLVHGLLVALQEGRFQYAAGLPMAPTLVQELTEFQMKLNERTGHDTYEAWREGSHDDLVLAVAMACWLAEQEAIGRWNAIQAERDEQAAEDDYQNNRIGPSY